jgi:2-polyprenyl-3-methyl-5-hydroxy-6-metoxy-1,4-benzoquinol methylase
VRYRFKGVELRTENAAKPYRQRSKFLCSEISRIPSDAIALDYGCGKFRYTIPLSRRLRHVCAVDSRHQLEREQQIANRRMSLQEYARRYLKNVSVSEIDSAHWRRKKFDFVLCANVLSVIPHRADRISVLRNLRRVLKKNGTLFVSTQYRNSYFNHWRSSPLATWARDGWFVKGIRGASIYAIIPPKKLGDLCRAAGLKVIRVGSKGEIAFVIAKA